MSELSLYNTRFQDLTERKRIWEILIKDFFQQFFTSHDTVLDIGCGFGEFINHIRCKKKIGLDIEKGYKEFLKKDVEFITTTSSKLPLKASSVNKIFISNVFEHLTREDIANTVLECHRILKPSGQVIILQPNIRFAAKDYWMFFDHITPVDDRALDEIFLSNAFTIKKKILRFLPYTTKNSLPKASFLIKIYLRLPYFWQFFGGQSLLIYEKS